MAGWTNRGKYLLFRAFFQAQDVPASFEAHLVTDAVAPGPDTNVLSDLTEIADGNGYVQATGIALARDETDFDTATEDDTGDKASMQIRDLVWTASGGTLPASGDGARYLVLTTPEAGAANKQVVGYHDLGSAITVSPGQDITVQNAQFDGLET